LLLAHDPARIAAPIVAKSHVRDGMLAVEMLQAFLQMNVKVAPGIVVIEGVAGAAGFVL
jgi:hypothetical protein